MREVENSKVPSIWMQQDGGVLHAFNGVYLGRIVGNDGWVAGYKDSAEQLIPDVGIILGVRQGSAGSTSVYARSLEDCIVETLNPDASTRETMWVGQSEESVDINTDPGNLGRVGFRAGDEWATKNFGNPGTRQGIIRVTSQDGEVRYFVVGADFKGEPDGWFVSGALMEVVPDTVLQLGVENVPLVPSPEDTSRRDVYEGEDTLDMRRLDLRTITALQTAYKHATTDVWILHAPDHAVEATSSFAQHTVQLLTELGRSNPYIFEGTGKMVDELGRRARLISDSQPGTFGFLHEIRDNNSARVKYLEAVGSLVASSPASSETGHRFVFFTDQAFTILERVLSRHAVFLDAASPVYSAITNIIELDHLATEEAKHRRSVVLKETILDPEFSNATVETAMVEPGQQITMDIDFLNPLLTREQVYQAFYHSKSTGGNSSSSVIEGYSMPAIATLEVNGKQYLLVDARGRSFNGGHSSKTGNFSTTGWRDDENPLRLLQITGEADSLYGERVLEDSVPLYGEGDWRTFSLRDLTQIDEHGFLLPTAKTGISFNLNNVGQLIIKASGEVPFTIRMNRP